MSFLEISFDFSNTISVRNFLVRQRLVSFNPGHKIRVVCPPQAANRLLTPWSRFLLEKLTGSQLVKKFSTFYGNRKFITAFTSARHLFLSWASSIQSITTHPTSWRSILILASHLRLVLPNGLFPSGLPTKTLYTPLLSPIRATCPAHLIILYFYQRNNIWCGVQIIKLFNM